MVLSKVGPFQPPDNSVLKFPMIFFSSTYKFRKRTLVPFLTISVLYENSCSHVLVFSAAQASLYADGTYFIFPHCLAISNSPSSLTQTSPSPSPSLPLALSLPSSLPPLSLPLVMQKHTRDPHQDMVTLLQFFYQGNLEATQTRVNSVLLAVMTLYGVPVGVGACSLVVPVFGCVAKEDPIFLPPLFGAQQ